VGGYVYIWEFLVRPEHVPEFVAAYGPDGDWVRLFRDGAGYVRTELHRDQTNPERFVTVDYWESRDAWQAFRTAAAAEWERLDARCEQWTSSEREIGRFDPVGRPASRP
jgi:heme-degrading monooxygenase HmoA